MIIKLFDVVQMKDGKIVTVLSIHPLGGGGKDFTGAIPRGFGAFRSSDVVKVLSPDEYPSITVPE